jgi:hypothetical protein
VCVLAFSTRLNWVTSVRLQPLNPPGGNPTLKRSMRQLKSKKIKIHPVHALRLCTGCTAHRGSRSIALPFHDHGTRKGRGVSVTPRPLFSPGKDPVPIVQEARWYQGR